MLPLRITAWLLSTGLMVLRPDVLLGQDYPTKPVRLVTSEYGGGTDLLSRLIGQGISGPLGQNVIVDNRGSAVSGELVFRASPDGYTLLVANNVLWIVPLMQKTPYDAAKDFAPIILAARAPNLLVVNPSLPVKSVKDLIALAKAKPGVLNYGSGGNGSSGHLAWELFKTMADVNMVRIPYKGGGPALNAVISGEVQMLFPSTGGAAPHVKSGRLRALAVTSAQPSALAPGLPTVAASGLPGYESVLTYAVFAPAKTPAKVIARLNKETARVLDVPDAKEKLFNSGMEVVGSSPEQLAAAMKSEVTRIGKVIKDAGIRSE